MYEFSHSLGPNATSSDVRFGAAIGGIAGHAADLAKPT